jgi:hypothetical protein
LLSGVAAKFQREAGDLAAEAERLNDLTAAAVKRGELLDRERNALGVLRAAARAAGRWANCTCRRTADTSAAAAATA